MNDQPDTTDTDLLGSLPRPNPRRLAVRLTAAARREVRNGSPWVFDGSITSVSDDGAAGDVAVVFDDRRRFVAVGLWDPSSPIRLRVLHAGSPRSIDAGLWRERVAAAAARRSSLRDDPDTTAYRVVHGENDALPGLVVDRYARTLVVRLDTAAWLPHLCDLVPCLVEELDPERIVLRLTRTARASIDERTDAPDADALDGAVVWGVPVDRPVRIRERGLTFEVDVVHGNKTGHFLDQRDNRALVRAASDGAAVLDVFSNTGGFSVAAAAGGARSVHLVDVSAGAIEAARHNLSLNRHIHTVRRCEVRTTVGDACAVLRSLRRERLRYDVVVLDPPSFASARRDVPGALRAYRRLTRAGLGLLAPNGLLVQASCSSRVGDEEFFAAVHDAAASTGVRLREERRTGHPVDHPIGFEHGGYLKAVFARRID